MLKIGLKNLKCYEKGCFSDDRTTVPIWHYGLSLHDSAKYQLWLVALQSSLIEVAKLIRLYKPSLKEKSYIVTLLENIKYFPAFVTLLFSLKKIKQFLMGSITSVVDYPKGGMTPDIGRGVRHSTPYPPQRKVNE